MTISPHARRAGRTASLLLLALLILAVAPAAEARIPLVFDHAGFRLAPGHDSCFTEFYYGVSRDSLTFEWVETDSIWQAGFRVSLIVRDTLGTVIDTVQKLVGTRVDSEAEAQRPNVKVLDVIPRYLAPGTYDVRLVVTDLASADSGWSELNRIVLRPLGAVDTLALSDLQFGYDLRYVGDGDLGASVKVKNGFYMEPNPSHLYSPEDSILWLYAELYNLAPDPFAYTVHVWVLDPKGDVVKDLGVDTLPRPGESALITYGIKLSDLEAQWNRVAIEVDHGDQSVTARDSFWIGSGAQAPSSAAQDEFTEEDAELHQKFIAYVATADEMKAYDALGLAGKRRFINDFWRRRDPDLTTPENEYFQEQVRRFNLANKWFSRSMTRRDDGWNTDRGRVLIMYGEPDEIAENPSSIGTWAWERWEYRQLEGGVYFIFLDWKNLGDYRLMHSNKQGERYDPDWQEKIDREGLDIINR